MRRHRVLGVLVVASGVVVAGAAAGVPSGSWKSPRPSTVEVASGPTSVSTTSTTRVPLAPVTACREVRDRLALVFEAQADLDARTAELDRALAGADGDSPGQGATRKGVGGTLVERKAFNDVRDDCYGLPSCREALDDLGSVVARQIHQDHAIDSAQTTLEHRELFSAENRDETLTRSVADAHVDGVTTAAGLDALPGAFDRCIVLGQ